MTKDDLEMMIDKDGLRKVLDTIALICNEKADHLRSNWQDTLSAKLWDTRASKVCKLADTVTFRY